MSLRDQIAAADDLTTSTVDVPEWGVTLTLRTPTLAERAAMVRRFFKDDGSTPVDNLADMYPALLIATCVDPETGEALFSEADAGIIQSKNGAVVERVANAALLLAGLSSEAVPTQSAASSSTASASIGTDSPNGSVAP